MAGFIKIDMRVGLVAGNDICVSYAIRPDGSIKFREPDFVPVASLTASLTRKVPRKPAMPKAPKRPWTKRAPLPMAAS